MRPQRHGSRWTYSCGCRCEPCRQSELVYRRARAHTHEGCGTPHGSARYERGCRCDVCRIAAVARMRDWRRRRALTSAADPRAQAAG